MPGQLRNGRKVEELREIDVPRVFAVDLLMDLEKQAKKSGGMVHALIGNHEAMNIYGDLRYTVPGEFASFKRSDSEEIQKRLWEQHLEELSTRS